MLRSAAVSAATAAVWLLALLGPGLSLAAEDGPQPDFSLCSRCYYRQTPPRGASAGSPLRPSCHTLPGGLALATLSKPDCDTAVYSAFHLSRGGTERGGQEEEELVVAVPALLSGGEDLSHPGTPLQLWDSTVASLVQSSIKPRCDTAGGDLYIITGAGRLQAAEDEDNKCQAEPLWSAVCCAAPEGQGGFTAGLIRESDDGERQVSVKELEEMLGLEELFSGGCGDSVEIPAGVDSDTAAGDAEKVSDSSGDSKEKVAGSDTADEVSNDAIEESDEALTAEGRAAGVDAQQETSNDEDAATSEKLGESQPTSAAVSESPEAVPEDQTVDEKDKDTNSSSTLVYLLSTTVSILTLPLRPVFSTVTQLPGQVLYVLQEDLGVLSGVPVDTCSLLRLLVSDSLSWMGTVGDSLLGIGETCFCNMYHCSSSMVGALLNSCYTGVTGVGTLAGDTLAIFGNALDSGWWVTKFFGGRLCDQGGGYAGKVISEMGGQAKAVGGGVGTLAWRSGNGVFQVFKLGEGMIMGIVGNVISNVREAFGQESE